MAYRMGQRNVMGAYPFHWHLVCVAAASPLPPFF